MWFGRAVSERALRPVRWPGRPGGVTLLRVGLVAVLLGLAATILHTPPSCTPPARQSANGPDGSGPDARERSGPDDPERPDPGDAARGGPDGPARDGATAVGPTGGPATTGPGGGASGGPPAGQADEGTGGTLPLPDGTVGVPVRLAEPAALAVVRPGSRVDLLAVPAGAPSPAPELIAPRALVLDVVGADALDGSSALYLALSPAHAHRTVGLPEGSRFAVLVRG